MNASITFSALSHHILYFESTQSLFIHFFKMFNYSSCSPGPKSLQTSYSLYLEDSPLYLAKSYLTLSLNLKITNSGKSFLISICVLFICGLAFH